MKLKLLSILILILGLKSFAQTPAQQKNILPLYNLYYLSKYLTANDLSDEQKKEVYGALSVSIGTNKEQEILANYIKEKGKNNQYSDFIGAFLNNKNTEIQNQKVTIINDFSSGNFDKYKDGKKDKDKYISIINNFSIAYKTLPLKEKEYQLRKNVLTLDSLKKSMEIQNASTIKVNNKILLDLVNSKDSIKKAAVEEKLKEEKKTIEKDSVIKKNYLDNVSAFVNTYIDNELNKTNTNQNFNFNEIEYTKTQIEINSIVQSAEQRASSTSFNLPSESDLINAMAIFLAKRAQQEAAIWFMDQLRKNLNNPLIYDAFPETIKLIESLEDYKTPNFNAAWRYAISTDFVRMPKSLANSTWVTNFVFDNNPEKAAVFSSGVNFGYDLNRLISEKYNYRDIIRYFYTNPDFEYAADSNNFLKNNKVQQLINRSISILYILTNEFFTIDKQDNKQTFRLLSYEEIRSLQPNQWLALGQLLNAKYGSKFDTDSAFFKNEFIAHQENLSKWIGNLLITLSQFDKVNKDFQKALEGKNDISSYNFYNVWQITSQIINNLDYNEYLFPTISKTDNKPNKFNIALIKDCIDIYDQIQNKNFTGGIQKTLNIIKELSSDNKKLILHEFYLKDVKVELTLNGLHFDINGVPGSLSSKYADKSLEIILEYSNSKEVFNFSNYLKIKPFLKFVNKADKDENYDVIKILEKDFDKNVTKISSILKLDKGTVIDLLKILSLYDGAGYSSDKLSAFLKSSQNIHRQSTVSNDEIDKVKYKYQDQLFKVTAFFGDVLAAKNEKELANVIDSHALPPTSYKLKRRVAHSIDLNGYVGAQVSGLITNGYTSLEDQFTAGITAPIGFAFTWTTSGPKHNNYGFTIDIVDLGNIVNHYLVSSTSDYEPDVHFSEIFSPAFSGMYSIKNTPFVLFGSVKFLPLKTTTTENGLLNNKTFDATIFSIGAKIDIPLVNLWTRIEHTDKKH